MCLPSQPSLSKRLETSETFPLPLPKLFFYPHQAAKRMCLKFHLVPVQRPHSRNKQLGRGVSEKIQLQKENEPERKKKIRSRVIIFLCVFGFELWHSQHVNTPHGVCCY